jgi:hypothetical protein
MSVHAKHCSESATTCQEGAGVTTELPKYVSPKANGKHLENLWLQQRRYPLQEARTG